MSNVRMNSKYFSSLGIFNLDPKIYLRFMTIFALKKVDCDESLFEYNSYSLVPSKKFLFLKFLEMLETHGIIKYIFNIVICFIFICKLYCVLYVFFLIESNFQLCTVPSAIYIYIYIYDHNQSMDCS